MQDVSHIAATKRCLVLDNRRTTNIQKNKTVNIGNEQNTTALNTVFHRRGDDKRIRLQSALSGTTHTA
jgi:hypothetical protein